MLVSTGVRRFACVLLFVGTVSAAAPTGESHPAQISHAYYRGQQLKMTLDGVMTAKSTARLGPWVLGAKLKDGQPHDSRKNLYVVFPGQQYHSDAAPEYDLTCLVNYLPDNEEPQDWDVYFALVLDPSVQNDFRDERDLVLGGQASFRPADLMEFDDIPAANFLRSAMKIDGMAGLSRFRHKNGMLPRVAIIAAHFAIRAAVRPEEVPSTQNAVPSTEYRASGEEEAAPSTGDSVPSANVVVPASTVVNSDGPRPSTPRKAPTCHSGPDFRICSYQ